MNTYKLKDEFNGLVISQKIYPSGIMITLNATQPLPSEALENYYRYPEFHQFIDVIPSTIRYEGVEPNQEKDGKKKNKRNSDQVTGESI